MKDLIEVKWSHWGKKQFPLWKNRKVWLIPTKRKLLWDKLRRIKVDGLKTRYTIHREFLVISHKGQ